jgi:hypothetical protein
MTNAGLARSNVETLTAHEVAEIVEIVEAQALTEMAEAIAPDAAARYDVHAERIGPAVALAMRRVDVPMFNRVVGLGITEPVTETVLDVIEAVYRGAPVRYLVQLSPTVLSSKLHARLEARGWPRKDNWVNLIRGTEPPPEVQTNLRIEHIGKEVAEPVARIMCVAFEVPDQYGAVFTGPIGQPSWHHYLAYDGDMPVAAGALFVRDQVAYLAGGATLPEHRKQGAQGALLSRRIRDAADLGCRYVVTETWEETPGRYNSSYHNLLRAGFRFAYARPNYIFFPR